MAFWIALAVLGVAVAGGIAYVVMRGLELRRDVKRSGASIGVELERINAVSREVELRATESAAASGRLRNAGARLAISRAQLEVQLAAVREARAQVRRVFWFVPGI